MPHNKKDVVQVLYVVTKLELGGAQKVCLALLDGVAHTGFKTSLISGEILMDLALLSNTPPPLEIKDLS